MNYEDLLKDPRWQKRRLEIMQRDNFTCQQCGNGLNNGVPLNVHHLRYYKNKQPWEYADTDLITLCEECHKKEHLKKKKPIIGNNFKDNKFVFFRSLLKEERLTADEKIVLCYILTHSDVAKKRIAIRLRLSRKTVISAFEKINTLRLLENPDKIKQHGYFELVHAEILKGELLIFYSYLLNKSEKYKYCIDTYKAAIGKQLGKTKVAITKLLNRLYEVGLAERLDNGKLLLKY